MLVLASRQCEMLKMAKKNNKKRKFKSNEKQLGARLKGFDFSDYDAYGVTGIDVFRYGMMNIKKEHASPQEVKILSKIILVENRMLERELNQQADELLLEKLYNELKNIKGFSRDKEQKLIKAIEKEFNSFIENEKYDEDVRMDLNQFYTIKRDSIEVQAMYVGITYEKAVEVFDKYLEDMEQNSVLENTSTSEHE